MTSAPDYIITFQFEDGRRERFGATGEAIEELVVPGPMFDWFYVPMRNGAALVNTAGLQWVSVVPATDFND